MQNSGFDERQQLIRHQAFTSYTILLLSELGMLFFRQTTTLLFKRRLTLIGHIFLIFCTSTYQLNHHIFWQNGLTQNELALLLLISSLLNFLALRQKYDKQPVILSNFSDSTTGFI